MLRKITIIWCVLIASFILWDTPSLFAQAPTGAKNRSYTFQASTTDPEGDALYYNFNWGDGSPETRSPSSGTVSSGATVSAAHTWTNMGVFSVYVVACDSTQCSLQSTPIVFTIALPTAPGAPAITSGTNPSTTGTYTLGWTPSDPHTMTSVPVSISQYDVYRQLNGGGFSPVGSVTSPSYSEANLPDGTYDYYTFARDDTVPTNVSNPSGTYQVIVSHPGGGTPPTAEFDWCTLKSDTVQYQDLSTDDGSVTGWEWNFGDGSENSILTSPTHNFATGQTTFLDEARFARGWYPLQKLFALARRAVSLIIPPAPLALAQTGIAHEQTVTGTSVGSASVTSASLTGVSNHLYLASITTRNHATVTSVSGLGLTWTLLRDQCSGRVATGVEVWKAQGTPSGNGTVTATLPVVVNAAVITVSRYSGVDPTNAVGNVVGANTLGTNDTVCSGGVDSSSYTANLTTTNANHYAYGVVAIRNTTHTPGSGYTERIEISAGAGGSVAKLAAEDRTVATPSTVAVNGTLSAVADWAMVGVEIKAASAAPTPPAAPTITPFTNVTATGMTVNWNDNANNEDGYRVYRNTAATKPGTPIVTLSADATTYTDPNPLICNTIYYWWVESYNVAGTTEDTDVQATTNCPGPGGPYQVTLTVTDNDGLPSSPTPHTVNLTTSPTCASFFSLNSAAATKCDEIGLTWTAAKAATSYTLYRKDGAGAWVQRFSGITGLFTYDTTVSPNNSYQYYLKAVLPSAGTLNNSTISPACTGTWSGNPPEVICPLSVATPSCVVTVDPLAPTSACGLITLNWQALSGATSYRVYRSVAVDNFASATLIASGLTVLTYTDRDIVPDVIYYYYVTSQTGANPSPGQSSKSVCFRGSQWQER